MAYFNKEQFISILNSKANMAVATPAHGVYLSVVKMLETLPDADVEAENIKPCPEAQCKQLKIAVNTMASVATAIEGIARYLKETAVELEAFAQTTREVSNELLDECENMEDKT